MGIFALKRTQHIKGDINKIWAFFSDPANLAKITPPEMNFKVTSPPEDHIYPGQVITYKVSPILGIPVTWMTEITHVDKNKMFVDEQRHGPYSIWHHQHIFKDQGDSVLMTDIVHYKPPFMIIGNIANSLFIRNKVEKIFDHREKIIEDITF